MQRASPGTRFVGLMQYNARVVNIRLRRFDAAGRELQRRYASTSLATWMPHLRLMNPDNAWRFLAHVEREPQGGVPPGCGGK